MEWRLRRAEPGDADALALVAAATFLETYAGTVSAADMLHHCRTRCSVEQFSSWIADDTTLVTIAEHVSGAAPIGFTALTAPDFPIDFGADAIELRRIYVLAPAHGAGLGPALIERALADGRSFGKSRMVLGTHPANGRARAFYERNGFRVIGERVFQVGAVSFTDPVYARDL